MPRGIPTNFVDRVGSILGVKAVALRPTETLHIERTADAAGVVVDQPRPGFVIPVQGVAVTTVEYRSVASSDVIELLESLGPDEVLLSDSSAALRRLGPGGTIFFADRTAVTVSAVVADRVFGAEEIITTNSQLVGGDGSELRFAIVRYVGSAEDLEAALAAALPEELGFGVHPRSAPSDQTTAVRSQVWIKQTFGEFAYQPTSGGRFRIDPDWVKENIVTVELPVLGTTSCHVIYAELLTKVMETLIESDNADAIDREAFAGCWNPRYVANSMRLSRHAWGAAADINFGNSLDGGPGSPVHPDLLAEMQRLGITSGHAWSIPDPGHFEYYGFPEDE